MTSPEPLCPLCSSRASGPAFPFGTVWNDRLFKYLRCGSCRSSFVHPTPTDDEFFLMYGQSAYHDCYYPDPHVEPTESHLSDVLPFLKARGKLLDFGCGNGAFLLTARAAGLECHGVELDEEARRAASANSGCPVHSLQALSESDLTFDVIHLGDVLEHLPDPAATLRELEPLLRSDGLFFIEGPIEDNRSVVLLASTLFGSLKKFFGRPTYGELPPFHLFRATASAQRAFFENRMGYRVRSFAASETGWPYRNPGDRLLRASSAGGFLRQLIGLSAIAIGKFLAQPPFFVGNRFSAVLAPTGLEAEPR